MFFCKLSAGALRTPEFTLQMCIFVNLIHSRADQRETKAIIGKEALTGQNGCVSTVVWMMFIFCLCLDILRSLALAFIHRGHRGALLDADVLRTCSCLCSTEEPQGPVIVPRPSLSQV